MPLYEYQCRDCGRLTDVRHGFGETVSQACPACGGELVRRFHPAGIVFKGSGFYVTDSRKATEASANGKLDGAKPDAPKTDGAKPDAAKADGAKSDAGKAGGDKAGTGKDGGPSTSGGKGGAKKAEGTAA